MKSTAVTRMICDGWWATVEIVWWCLVRDLVLVLVAGAHASGIQLIAKIQCST